MDAVIDKVLFLLLPFAVFSFYFHSSLYIFLIISHCFCFIVYYSLNSLFLRVRYYLKSRNHFGPSFADVWNLLFRAVRAPMIVYGVI